MEEVKVSVICVAYNHEKFISVCLDSLLSQKTNFKYEILVNDDCSTDNTAGIIQEYAKKYPEIVKPTFQKENQYSKGVNITQKILVPQAQGKYLAFCEGDDYWCDENKLQMQYDILENNEKCRLCTHTTVFVDENGNNAGGGGSYRLPSKWLDEGIYSSKEILKIFSQIGFLFHLTSYFIRKKDYLEYAVLKADFKNIYRYEDLPLLLYFFQLGDVYYFNKVMSCWRKVKKSITHSIVNKKEIFKWLEETYACVDEFEKFCNGKYAGLNDYFPKRVYALFFEQKMYKEILKDKKYHCLKNKNFRTKFSIFIRATLPFLFKNN